MVSSSFYCITSRDFRAAMGFPTILLSTGPKNATETLLDHGPRVGNVGRGIPEHGHVLHHHEHDGHRTLEHDGEHQLIIIHIVRFSGNSPSPSRPPTTTTTSAPPPSRPPPPGVLSITLTVRAIEANTINVAIRRTESNLQGGR